MGDFFAILIIPEEIDSLLAILGLLLCWELHDKEVRQGRIKPKNVLFYLTLARSIHLRQGATPWLFIYLSRNDSQSCAQCLKAHLHVFLGSNLSEAQGQIRCVNPHGCRCVVIPMIGHGPMAGRLRARLSSQRKSNKLSERDLHSLIHQGGTISQQDDPACKVLRAMLGEETNPQMARETYYQAIAAAPDGSNALLQAAVYIRLTDLLERSGDVQEALHVTHAFKKAFPEKDRQCVLAKPQYDGIMARLTNLIRRRLCPPGTSEFR